MDTALVLRMRFDKGELISDKEINTLLEQSQVV